MKFFLFLFIPIIIFSQQSGEVIYSVNIKQNDTLPISDKRWQSSIQFLADSVTFKLLYAEEKAYFELIQDQNYENLIQFFQEQNQRIKNSTYQPESYFYYAGPTWQINNFNYRFKKRKKFVDDCIVKEKWKEEWFITNDEMNIQGYNCRKAQLKTSFFDSDRLKHQDVIVTAWFTDDIPYPYGPNFFNGLPGLVLKYEDVYFEYTATKIEFKEIEIPLIPPSLPIISPAEYKEKWMKEMKKF